MGGQSGLDKTNEYDNGGEQLYFLRMCKPDLECKRFDIDICQSKAEIRIDLNITSKRHEKMEKQILSQKLQVFNSKDLRSGVETIWMMKHKNYTKTRLAAFEDKIEISYDCSPDDAECAILLKILKLKSKYHHHMSLIITSLENSSNINIEDERVNTHMVECPQKDIVLNWWR